MKFKNNQNIDVYVDLGTLKRIAPGEIIDLPGALTCASLTPLMEEEVVNPPKVFKKKPLKTPKKTSTSGTI
tara:strand:+ start:191 stop:403 length:213 start_codon:yes stop_codon:yes gene_type:complete